MGFGAVLFAAMDALSAEDKADREAAIVELGDTIELQISPAGTIIAFGGTSAPTGYQECDGGAVSRTGESVLFAAIGTTWGVGDGSTTFNKPDLRGGFMRGTGSHGSEAMADSNPFAGPAVGAFEDDQMQGHRHEFNRTRVAEAESGAAKWSFNNETNASGEVLDPITDGVNDTPRTGDETRPFAAGVLYCIKT